MLVGAELRRLVASVASVATLATTIVAAGAAVIVASPGTASAAFSCSSGGPSYTVRSGDGWYIIADRVDVTARSLLDVNDASTSDVLVPGDRLCLPPGADLAAACGSSYSVRSGDGWFAIADRVGVSVGSLLGANGADLSRSLHPGQRICLPDGASAPATTNGSSSSGGSGGGSSGSSGGGGGATYTVARGDSWFGIASRAGVSGSALLAANDASSGDVIIPGEVIRLPSGAEQPTSNAPQQYWVDLEALPIQGPCGYADTWRHSRGGGRRHKGTDMFSQPGNYVYAVVDGRLTDRNWAQPGQISGNSWTLTAADGTYFFYAHLADFNPDLGVGSRVRAGQILGWIGATGNASSAHLHFEIHPGGGDAVNPYPILRAEGGCRRGTPYTQPSGWVPDRIG